MKIAQKTLVKPAEPQTEAGYFQNLTYFAKRHPLQSAMIATAVLIATCIGLHSFFSKAVLIAKPILPKPIFPKLAKQPMTLCQRVETLSNYSCKTAESAQLLREKGLAELQKAGTSLTQLDVEIRQKTSISAVANSALRGIAGYADRLEKGILKVITVSRLKSLFGYTQLNNSEARKLYNQLDGLVPTVLKSERLSNMGCEAQAKFAADSRFAIREYIRDRIHTGRAEVNHLRNLCKYGTEPDFAFLRGTKNCSQIIKSSQKTSWFHNLAADYWPCT